MNIVITPTVVSGCPDGPQGPHALAQEPLHPEGVPQAQGGSQGALERFSRSLE